MNRCPQRPQTHPSAEPPQTIPARGWMLSPPFGGVTRLDGLLVCEKLVESALPFDFWNDGERDFLGVQLQAELAQSRFLRQLVAGIKKSFLLLGVLRAG